jgi:hypothetical protein
MNDLILSLVMECRKGIKEFRDFLETCIAVQRKPIQSARILRYLDAVESGKMISMEEFAIIENLSYLLLCGDIRKMMRICFNDQRTYSQRAMSLLLKMYCKKEWEFFARYVFTSPAPD